MYRYFALATSEGTLVTARLQRGPDGLARTLRKGGVLAKDADGSERFVAASEVLSFEELPLRLGGS